MRALRTAIACTFTLAAGLACAAIDPNNMGKGDWVYVLTTARANVGATTNAQYMTYLKGKGIKWISVKCGDYGTWWPQFDANLITEAKAAGIFILGYQRVGGDNLTAEINVGKQCLAAGADGYIVDAEVEFEGKFSQATTMMQGLRATYPTAFIAHAPLPYIDYHTAFPYVEFGTYCDATMPQAYWTDIGITPAVMLTDMNAQWNKWHATWTSQGKSAAIKPLVPIAQGHSGVVASEITSFVNSLKSNTTGPNALGYTGISFWSSQHHTTAVWSAIGSATIDGTTSPLGITIDNGASGYSETGTWTNSASAGFYNTNSRYATVGGAHKANFTPTLATTGNYDVYAWWVAGSNRASAARYVVTSATGTSNVNANQTASGGKWNLLGTYTFNAGSTGKVQLDATASTGGAVASADAVRFILKPPTDVIVDNTTAGSFTASTSWTTETSTPGYYGTNYRIRPTASASDAAVWKAQLFTTGNYKVYARYTSAANRAASAPYQVLHTGGTTTVNVNQQTNGGTWVLLGTYNMVAGTADRVKLSCWTTAGSYVVADAVRFEKQ